MDQQIGDNPEKKSIPVICNGSRSEDGGGRNSRSIFINPKFFGHGQPNQSNNFMNQQQRFEFQPSRFQNFQRFEVQPMTPANFPHGPQMTPGFYEPRLERFEFHSRLPDQFHWRAQGPPQEQFGYQTNHYLPIPDMGCNIPQGPFMDSHAQPAFYGNSIPTHFPAYATGPPQHYESEGYLNEKSSVRNTKRSRTRSRSRTPLCRRYGRRSSLSSYERDVSRRRSRRSRSLSSQSMSPRSNKTGSSRSKSSDVAGALWDSDYERNSDLEMDLSKNLESLTVHVSDSKLLLKEAIKCLGPEKIRTMIPLEFTGMDRNHIFNMCEKLLDETDSDLLVKVMEGSYHLSMEQEATPSEDENHCTTSSSDKDKSSPERRKSHKKKSKKRKRKKKRKNAKKQVSGSETSEESEELESSNDSESAEETRGNVHEDPLPSLPQLGSSSSITQQSLLELIQIEYKTKAINVMLKHLGVATEINNLVSNAIQTSAISVQIPSATNENPVNPTPPLSSDVQTIGSAKDAFDDILPTFTCATAGVAIKEKTENIPKNSGAESAEELSQQDTGIEDLSDGKSNESHQFESDKQKEPLIDDAEFLEEVCDDVLDIEIGANEELELP